MGEVLVLSREDRVLKFGVDCVGPHDSDGICFSGGEWVPGGEYIKKLRVKNVSTKSVKLKYKLPVTRYFAMTFPEVIHLNPGMVKEIDVAFRPVTYENYNDTIYFRVVEDLSLNDQMPPIGFHVPVRAFISTLQILAPEGLDFGFCTVKEESIREFELVNTGQVPAPFQWEMVDYHLFDLEPKEGEIPVGASQTIRVSFTPIEASVYICSAVCHVGQGVNAIKPAPELVTKLSAIGKYPHLTASEDTLDFGEVQMGSQTADKVCRQFYLRNPSVVAVSFRVIREESDCDCVYSISPSEGIVPLQSEVRIQVTYNPQTAGTFSCENFIFTTPGGNCPRLTVTGSAIGPGVTLTKRVNPPASLTATEGSKPLPCPIVIPNSINFNDVKVGQSMSRVVFLSNGSSLPAYFNFVLPGEEENGDQGSVFAFDRTRGLIPPGLETHVDITFTPQTPANYYRRIFCLVEHQHPLYLDVFGEIQEQRPAPLRHAHIQAFRNRVAAGMGHLSPDELDKMLEDEEDIGVLSDFFAKPKGTQIMAKCKVNHPVTRSGEATRNEVAVSSEYFIDWNDKENQVILDRNHLDFGFLANGSTRKHVIRVTNCSNAKVTAVWTPVKDGSFEILPQSMDISVHSTQEFIVLFRPSTTNVYYSRALEVLVYLKSQRSFRLVNDATMTPPWMLNVTVTGHTFPDEQFLAKVSVGIKNKRLTFPACHVGDSVYQTIRLTNHGNLPASYQLSLGEPESPFSAKPAMGIVPANNFQLIELRFNPKQARTYKIKLHFVFNNSEETQEEALLVGLGQVPHLSVCGATAATSADDGIYIKPTAVGLVSTVNFQVQNGTRIPLAFHVDLPDGLREVFSVSPAGGRLKGKESREIQLSFAPNREKTYRLNLPIKVKPLAGPAPDFRDAGQIGEAAPPKPIQTINLKVLAPAAAPALAFEPKSVDFGVLLVNDECLRELVLVNNSDSDIYYELLYVHYPSTLKEENSAAPAGMTVKPLISDVKADLLVVDKPKGVLPARSKAKTTMTFKPGSSNDYKFAIFANLRSVDEDGLPICLTPSEAALQTLSHQMQSSAAVITSGMGDEEELVEAVPGTGQVEVCGTSLICGVTGKATFPTITIRDIRLQNGGLSSSTQQLWRQFNLTCINSMLMQPLTSEEIAFNRESSPDLQKLPKITVSFTPNIQGETSQMAYLQLYNSGHLPTSFSFHYPNEREIELEHWADEGEPTEEEVLHSAVIDELKCFDIFPKVGSLLPGETLTLNLAYHYTSMRFHGRHRLPILLRISRGKQFWIVLEGRTVEPGQPFMYTLTGPEESYELFPVPIGTKLQDAPLQFTELVNPTNFDIHFQVDASMLEKIRHKSWDLDVLSLETSRGLIRARSRALLKWRFCPLEVRTYKARIHINYGIPDAMTTGEKVTKFTVVGRGYDLREEDYHRKPVPHINAGLRAPCFQMVRPPETLAILSSDCLELGRIPARSVFTRVLILRNVLSDKNVEFRWEDQNHFMQMGVVDFVPKYGLLPPLGFTVLRVMVHANCNPLVINNSFELRLKEVPIAKANRTKGAMEHLKAKLSQRSISKSGMGLSHQPLVSRSTVSMSALLETIRIPRAEDHDKKAHLPTAETRSPPPGPQGSPIKRLSPGKQRQQMDLARAPTARSLRSVSSFRSTRSNANVASDVEAVDPVTALLEFHLQAEILREPSMKENVEVSKHLITHPERFIAPDIIALPGDKMISGSTSQNNIDSNEENAVVGYEHEDYLDEEGGSLVREVFEALAHEVLSSTELEQTFRYLPSERRQPFVMELKPSRPLYDRLAESMGIARKDSNYQVLVSALLTKMKELDLPVKGKGTREIVAALSNEEKLEKINQSNQHMNGDRMVDLRKFVSRLPVKIRNALEAVLITNQVTSNRFKRRRSSSYSYGPENHNNLSMPPHNPFPIVNHVEDDRSPPVDSKRDNASTTIQGMYRSRKSRQLAAEALSAKVDQIASKEALQDSECVGIIAATLEETMYNLLQETLTGEFDPKIAPKQYVFTE